VARVEIDLPERFLFETEIPVRIWGMLEIP